MLSDVQKDSYFESKKFSDEARKYIRMVSSSEPSRSVKEVRYQNTSSVIYAENGEHIVQL